MLQNASETTSALESLGEILAAQGADMPIVIIGGAALNLLGVVDRATRDVDVLAVELSDALGTRLAPPPDPLPAVLANAVRDVARDRGLPEDWLNTGPALQWKQGLPPASPSGFPGAASAGYAWGLWGGLT